MSGRRPLARGDVILVLFPFTDLSGQKLRPGLIVGRVRGDDVIVAFMTSRLAHTDPRAECLLAPPDPEFSNTGLKGPALLRLDRVATLERRLVQRRLGTVGPRTEAEVSRCLGYVFGL